MCAWAVPSTLLFVVRDPSSRPRLPMPAACGNRFPFSPAPCANHAQIMSKTTVGSGPQDQWTRSPDPQRANRRYTGGQGYPPQFSRIGEILGKPFSGGVWGETGTPKGLLGTIQSIWVRGNPLISIFETIPPQNHVFRAPFWGPGTSPGQPKPAWPPDKS